MFSRKLLFLTAFLAPFILPAADGFSFSNPTAVTTKTPPQDQQQHHSHDDQIRSLSLSSLTDQVARKCAQGLLVACLCAPQLAVAVSGGGLDFANLDITGQDFSNEPKAYKGKDFTQVRPILLESVWCNTVVQMIQQCKSRVII